MDEQTNRAYRENAATYSQDWLSQPEPSDVYGHLKRFFVPNGFTADIGCGNGRDSNWMQMNGFRVTGYDCSEELLRLARVRFPAVDFKRAVLPELNEIQDQYDNIFCETVIMHLPKSEVTQALTNLKRILKRDGVLYLSWRVVEGDDVRHKDGRLYSSFDPKLVTDQFSAHGVLLAEDKISLSSQKRVSRLIWQNVSEVGKVKLRTATIEDLSTLTKWDNEPHVIESDPKDEWNWELELCRFPSWREQFIAEVDGQPIGCVQIIDPKEEETHYWGECENNLRAIDIWIGEKAFLGRGFGSEMMKLAIERCFADPSVKAILIDPLASNVRAIKFYERFGFQFLEHRYFEEDYCYVMRLDRN